MKLKLQKLDKNLLEQGLIDSLSPDEKELLGQLVRAQSEQGDLNALKPKAIYDEVSEVTTVVDNMQALEQLQASLEDPNFNIGAFLGKLSEKDKALLESVLD